MENPRVRFRARYRHSSQFLRTVNIYSQNPTMDFPSENWVYNDWDDFDTASANMVRDYTLEVFTRNGRAFSPPQQWSSKRLDYNALDESNTAPCTYQREGRLRRTGSTMTGTISTRPPPTWWGTTRPAEEHRPHPGIPFLV